MNFHRGWSDSFVVALASLTVFACGGGGDDPPPTPSALQILARDGDTFPGSFEVGTIESAKMSDDGSVAIIASERATPSLNGVFLRSPSGSLRSIIKPNSPLGEGLSFADIRSLSMSPRGEFAFEVGNRLDDDGLFYWNGEELSVLARTAPGQSPNDFRVLGAMRVGGDGAVVFSAGVSPCEVNETDPGSEQVRCDLKLYSAQADEVTLVEVPNALTDEKPTAVVIEVNSQGAAAMGLPASGREPIVGVVTQGVFEGLVERRQEVPGLGVLRSLSPRAISQTGAMALDGRVDTDGDTEWDEEHVFFLEDGALVSVAKSGGSFEGNPEVDLRAEGIDDYNRVVYRVEFESEAADRALISLRAWQGGETIFIAHEGKSMGEDDKGNQIRILDIEQVRVAPNGDVLFVTRTGWIDEETETRRITGTSLMRWDGGSLDTVLSLGARVGDGELVNQISVADVNSRGDLLLISAIDRSANRVLLFLPRDGVV